MFNTLKNITILKFLELMLSIWIVFFVLAIFYALITQKKRGSSVVVVDNPYVYKLIHPLSRGSLGQAFPVFGVGFVNSTRAKNRGVDVNDIVKHEEEHIIQYKELGFYNYYFTTENWVLEGLAEYVRSRPTLDPCGTKYNDQTIEYKYLTYFLSVKHMLEEKKISKNELYKFEGGPPSYINIEHEILRYCLN